MARGGTRPGAGRRKGAKSTRTQEIALKAAEDGATPIEVMMWFMRATLDEAQKAQSAGDLERTMQFGALSMGAADKAAPYVHPKMAPKAPDDGTGAGYTVFKLGGVLNGNLSITSSAPRGADGSVEEPD